MNDSKPCGQELLLQADFDGELDAGQAAQLAAHRAQCPRCQLTAERLALSRARMRTATRHAAPPALREAVLARIARESGAPPAAMLIRPRRWRTMSAWLGGALAATVMVALLVDRGSDVEDRLLDSHLRAMRAPVLLTDVAASSHHTVKPWFAGKLSYAPVVKDLDAAGYALLGGRIDVVDGRQVAVVVYRAGPHIIDVFEWPASSSPALPTRASRDNGFDLRHWTDGDMTFWCVSDLSAEELDRFVAQWRHPT
jgi:anti-sigma factor RsiW